MVRRGFAKALTTPELRLQYFLFHTFLQAPHSTRRSEETLTPFGVNTAADRDFEPRRLLDQMAPVVSATLGDPADAAVFARGIARAFSARAVGSRDVFRGAEVVAACAVALLSCSHEEAIDAAIKDMAIQALDLTSTAIAETADLIKENKYLPLSCQGLFGDLFYLPVGLTRILGWIGTQHFICEWVGKHSAFYDAP